ncbi:hypothetical protein D3C80_1960560 [compost metagenome]
MVKVSASASPSSGLMPRRFLMSFFFSSAIWSDELWSYSGLVSSVSSSVSLSMARPNLMASRMRHQM